MVLLVMPVFLKGADKSANSHIILRVCLGSIISSIKKDSADLRGDLNLFNLVVIFLYKINKLHKFICYIYKSCLHMVVIRIIFKDVP